MSAPILLLQESQVTSPLEAMRQEVRDLKIHALPNYHKRIMVKALKAKYASLSIRKICEVVEIKKSTYYYKPRRLYLPYYVHERKVDPEQFAALKEELSAYPLCMMDNASKRHLVRILSQKYDRLTIRKICQLVQINVSTYYYKPIPVMQSLRKIQLVIKVRLFFAGQRALKSHQQEADFDPLPLYNSVA